MKVIASIVAVFSLCLAVFLFFSQGNSGFERTAIGSRESIATEAVGTGGAESANGAASYVTQLENARRFQVDSSSLYAYRPTPGIEGRKELDRIFIEGVPATREAVVFARELLRKNISDDEKIALARILGGLYGRDDPTGFNADILLDLRELASSSHVEVARSAVFVFSRLGYLPGSDLFLDDAYARGVLIADDYYGELAHMASTSPGAIQEKIVEELTASGNDYSRKVLFSYINDGSLNLGLVSARALSEIQGLLKYGEPSFSSAVGVFGFSEVIEYSSWL
jgi:hypothetical protein